MEAIIRCSMASLLLPLFLFILLLIILFTTPHNRNQISFPVPFSATNFTTTQLQPHEFLANSPYKSFEHNKTTSTIKEMTSLGKVEQGLAEARASIMQAIMSRNYSALEMKDNFIPNGSIYRNPYAFYQSHMEMVKRLKVWVYSEGEQPIVHDGPFNNIYAMEGQFIDEIDNSRVMSPFKARNPEEAHVFFLPFSVANVVRYVYKPIMSQQDYYRDRLQRLVEDYIGVVKYKYPYWNRSNGADHFLLSCHDWESQVEIESSSRISLEPYVMPIFQKGFSPKGMYHVSVSEVYLPVGKLGPPSLAQHPMNRTILAFFAGGAHGPIRNILLNHWKDKDSQIQVHEYLPKGQNYTKLMGLSKFCLCPSGYEVASPRITEAIYAECVPVIISDNYSLPFSDVLNWRQFSIEISVENIPNIKAILESVSKRKYMKLHMNVRKVRRHFVLNRPAKPFDVIHMILHSIWLRRLNFKLLASQ